jgi:RNA polymerase sigma-70 factor (ECF subfamily)
MFAYRRVRDRALAEDLAQETLRQVGLALEQGRLENPAALPGFVFQTAQHLCLQRYRSETREARAMERLERESAIDRKEYDPLSQLVDGERRAEVRRAMNRLDPSDRRLLERLYFQDLPHAIIAAELGVTPEALRVRKHRALRRLAVLLGDAEPGVTP